MNQHLRKAFLVIFSAFSAIQFYAQSYHPMPVDEAQWDVTRCWSFYPGGWHDEYSFQLDGTDTLINGHLYKNIYIITHHLPGTEHDSIYTNYLGAMREADKQVFFISEYLALDTVERMVYDFNPVDIGDTIFSQILTHDLLQFIPHIVTSLDSVIVDGQYRRRIHLRDQDSLYTESWIDGVGSSMGLVYASYWLLTDNSYDLNCHYQDGELAYTNQEPTHNFCSFPLPEIACETTSSDTPVRDTELSLFPNPAFDQIYIRSSRLIASAIVYTSQGYEVLTCGPVNTLSLESLSSGIYFVRLTDQNGRLISIEKFVKI